MSKKVSKYPYKVLYVGQLFEGSTALHRCRSIELYCNEVHTINTYNKRGYKLTNRILQKITKILFNEKVDLIGVNRLIIQEIKKKRNIDFLWIDKSVDIKPSTLNYVKQLNSRIKLIYYSPDDMMSPILNTKRFLNCVPIFDYYITTKSFNVEEIRRLGGKRILFVNNAFDSNSHKPFKYAGNEIFDVCFIGTFEYDRYKKMLFLANSGIKVMVFGGDPKWKKYIGLNKNLIIINKWLWGEEYAEVLSRSKISLNFLKKKFRDQQTQRSVEIPAVGSFMLTERTAEHISLFKEGVEAEFFDNEVELLDKVKFYLENDKMREEIRLNGHNKCIHNYSNDTMIKNVLNWINIKE